jgi:hypothetical protein
VFADKLFTSTILTKLATWGLNISFKYLTRAISYGLAFISDPGTAIAQWVEINWCGNKNCLGVNW